MVFFAGIDNCLVESDIKGMVLLMVFFAKNA